jgi:enoyl-CoA hydratase/carnithine racemase
VILTGAGNGGSGADVADQAAALSRQSEQPTQAESTNGATAGTSGITQLAPHIRRIPQPVIAAINGVAAGAGFSITVASDVRIASELARFSCIFVKRSLVPDTASSYTLASIVGVGTAMEMALTGRVYGTEWALQKGLVNTLVPPSELMTTARLIADEIAANPPICVRSIKQLMYTHGPGLDEILPVESQANAPSTGTQDRREAVLSFMERRQPVYYGR